MKTLDEGLAEAISSIIWVTPRLQADVQELKIVSEQLAAKVITSSCQIQFHLYLQI
jgi:vacuolar protein sorting-associated protein IST1